MPFAANLQGAGSGGMHGGLAFLTQNRGHHLATRTDQDRPKIDFETANSLGRKVSNIKSGVNKPEKVAIA